MKKRFFLLTLPAFIFGSFAVPSLNAGPDSLKIIKFEADWCGPCQQMKPAFAAVSKSSKGVAFQTVDVDRQSSLSDRYKVEGLPTVIAVKNGREVGRLVGLQSEGQLRKFIKKHQ